MTTNYIAQAESFAKKHGISLQIIGEPEYKKHFTNDTHARFVFKVRLKRKGKQFTFAFGQSTANGIEPPTMYDVLSCLTKCDPWTLEDFISEYGYERKEAKKIYPKVVKEYNNVMNLFGDIIEELQEVC